ncbi:MAG: molybdopterin oxidoreductase [Firmicutes bacterium HGW-Firmicutes-7]|nr:MAG: molybdopterin oxidoreductase [Firmicutes bacterium HGW-Firmicutes-7]
MNSEILVCIICPKACILNIEMENEKIISILGNKCKRGVDYAEKELTNPERALSSTVLIKGGVLPLLPVRSSKALPKDSLIKVMEVIDKTEVVAPVKIGDIIVKNVSNLGVDIIASRSMRKVI